MASYLQGVTDQGLQTPTYQPDFSFLAANQQKKEGQYMQGLSEVASGYNAILSAPVTDEANKITKGQYVKTAQDGLKKLSTSDLSLPTNVAQAETLYAPFYQDNILLQDIGYTKYAQGELGKLDNWKNSKDKEVYSRYSPYAERYIQQGLQDLSQANRDPGNYKKLQKREAIPFFDINAEVDAAWETEIGKGKGGSENGIATVTTDGHGAMITQYNGIKSKDAYRTYYLSKVGDRYDQQFRVIASVKYHDAKQDILRKNPGIDEKAVNEHFAKDILQDLGSSYKKVAQEYNDQADYWAKRKKDLIDQIKQNQKGIVAPSQKSDLAYYDGKMKDYKNAGTSYSQEYWNNYSPVTQTGLPNENYTKTFNGITRSPDEYTAGIEKNQMAELWASGRASISSEKKEVDPTWHEYRFWADADTKNRLESQRIAVTARGQTLHWEEQTGTDLKTGKILPNFNPNRSHGWYGEISGDGTNDTNGSGAGSGDIIGVNTIDPAHIEGGAAVVQQLLESKRITIGHQIFNPSADGISGIALKTLNLTPDEIIDFTEGAKVMMNGTIPNDPRQLAAIDKVKTSLKQQHIGYDIKGPGGLETALMEYSESAAAQLQHSDKQSDVVLGNKLLAGAIVAQSQRDSYIKSQKNLDNALNETILTNPAFSKLTFKDANGYKQRMTAENITPYFPSVHVWDPIEKKYQDIPAKELANSFMRGDFNFSGSNEVTIGGKEYHIDDHATYEGLSNLEKGNSPLKGKIIQSDIFSKLLRSANTETMSKLKEYKNGILYKEISYDPNADKKGNKKQAQFALNLAPELASISNTDHFYLYDPKSKSEEELGPDHTTAIRNMLTNTPDVQAYVGSIIPTRNDRNEQVFAIHMKVPDKAPNSKDSKLDNLAGKTVFLKVSPNATGKHMKEVPQNDGLYTYGDLYYGGTYKSSGIINSSGVSYSIRGYDFGPDGKATKINVIINQRIKDPEHIGKYIDQPTVNVSIPTVGENAKNIDEIVSAANGSAIQHGNQNVANNNLAHSRITSGQDINEVENELNNNQ